MMNAILAAARLRKPRRSEYMGGVSARGADAFRRDKALYRDGMLPLAAGIGIALFLAGFAWIVNPLSSTASMAGFAWLVALAVAGGCAAYLEIVE